MSTSPSDIVAAIDAAILTMLAGGGAQSLAIAGKSITYSSLAELQKARAFYSRISEAESSTDGCIHKTELTFRGEN
jgi:hypothetical protein